MLKFFIGVVVGGIVGFLVSAVLSINNAENDRNLPILVNKEAGYRILHTHWNHWFLPTDRTVVWTGPVLK